MLSKHFLIEINRRVVGLAIRVKGGFRFVASDIAFRKLEGKVFSKLRLIDRSAEEAAVIRDKRSNAF